MVADLHGVNTATVIIPRSQWFNNQLARFLGI